MGSAEAGSGVKEEVAAGEEEGEEMEAEKEEVGWEEALEEEEEADWAAAAAEGEEEVPEVSAAGSEVGGSEKAAPVAQATEKVAVPARKRLLTCVRAVGGRRVSGQETAESRAHVGGYAAG